MHFGMRRFLAVLATASLMALLLGAVNTGSAAAAPGTWLSRINAYRAANGRSRVVEDYQASRVAQSWTLQMAATRKLAHNPGYRALLTTPSYRTGENIGYSSSEAALFTLFLNSPAHRANMLRPEFNRVGIGQVVANGRVWTTHIFLATRAATFVRAA